VFIFWPFLLAWMTSEWETWHGYFKKLYRKAFKKKKAFFDIEARDEQDARNILSLALIFQLKAHFEDLTTVRILVPGAATNESTEAVEQPLEFFASRSSQEIFQDFEALLLMLKQGKKVQPPSEKIWFHLCAMINASTTSAQPIAPWKLFYVALKFHLQDRPATQDTVGAYGKLTPKPNEEGVLIVHPNFWIGELCSITHKMPESIAMAIIEILKTLSPEIDIVFPRKPNVHIKTNYAHQVVQWCVQNRRHVCVYGACPSIRGTPYVHH
jgi:hypothetical protein